VIHIQHITTRCRSARCNWVRARLGCYISLTVSFFGATRVENALPRPPLRRHLHWLQILEDVDCCQHVAFGIIELHDAHFQQPHSHIGESNVHRPGESPISFRRLPPTFKFRFPPLGPRVLVSRSGQDALGARNCFRVKASVRNTNRVCS
jgi:hypothetical protein